MDISRSSKEFQGNMLQMSLSQGQWAVYKVRLVVKGYAQKESIDYNEIFPPVVKHTSIRMLLVIVIQFNLELE